MVKKRLQLSKNSTVLFVSFSKWENNKRLPTNGSIEPLRDFLVPKIKKLVIIDQLHPGSEGVMPKIEVYGHNNKEFKSNKSSWFIYLLRPLLEKYNKSSTQPIFKVRDFLSVIDWSFRDKTNYDYCICLESINTIAAILLRKLGRVKTVVYYVSDYSPNRYPSKWFNNLYLKLDRFCATHADYIWDVSPAMQKARIEVGLDPERSAPVILVANGLYEEQIKSYPINKIDRFALAYMGTVNADNGPDIAIEATEILSKKFKKISLHLVGGTEKDRQWLEKIVHKKKLSKFIHFYGFIEDGVKMSEVLRKCSIGLAPYRYIPGSIRLYADAGKIRAYAAAGLAVVSSQVPPLGHTLAKQGGALIAEDSPRSFADAVERLLTNKNEFESIRKKAIAFAKNSTWENTFSSAFNQMNKQ
jgi:glycosyltransferase involved in cell wall biosynthesis